MAVTLGGALGQQDRRVPHAHPQARVALRADGLDFDALAAVEKRTEPFHSFPRYPAVTRDFALLHDRDADYGLIDTAVAELAATNAGFAALFESLELFDLYQGEQVPEGKRSLAIQVVYRASDRTLTDEEVARADEALLGHLRAAAGASLRS